MSLALAIACPGCIATEDIRHSLRIERIELLDERGSPTECEGRLTLTSRNAQRYLAAGRHAIDPAAPLVRLPTVELTWYFWRLPRGCYLPK